MVIEERLKCILGEVAQYFNYKTWNFTSKPTNETIENYFGVLIPVTINGIIDSENESKSLFVKIPPLKIADDLITTIRQHYEVEIHTYQTLIPIYRSITNTNMNFIPECYYASSVRNKEVLVLLDMTSKGFKRYDGSTLDLKHTVVSLRTLARFHCLSIVFKEKGFKFDADIMKPYTLHHPEMYHKYIDESLQRHIYLFDENKYHIYLKSLLENSASNIIKATSEAYFLVYGHGDFWRENILFKYENDKPIEACLLDFQKSRILSPAQDILLFLLGNTEASLRKKHHKYFLDVYLEELHYNLKENGLNNIYSMENLVRDMKTVAPTCAAISTMGYSLCLGLGHIDIVKSENGGNNVKLKLQQLKKKVVDMLEELVDYGYVKL